MARALGGEGKTGLYLLPESGDSKAVKLFSLVLIAS
jgi:hypothetical protein